MLNSKQRAYLRGLAMKLDPIFQIGKGGIGDESVKQIANALEARELIKVHVLDNSPYTPREAAETLAEATDSQVVTVIGKKFVLYRRNEKDPVITLDR